MRYKLLFIYFFFFFFNDTATTEIYTLSLHDALPISTTATRRSRVRRSWTRPCGRRPATGTSTARSEEHTSELQSPCNLVCRLLLEKKKKKHTPRHTFHPQTLLVPSQLKSPGLLYYYT